MEISKKSTTTCYSTKGGFCLHSLTVFPAYENDAIANRTEIVEQVMRNKYKLDIKKAVEQGGKMVFINASFSTIAHDVAAIDYNNDIDGNKKFNQLLQNALQNVQASSSASLPVIVSVDSVASFQQQSFVWYQTYYSFYVPIIIAKDGKVMLDGNRYTDYNIRNTIDVNGIKFKKCPFDGSINQGH